MRALTIVLIRRCAWHRAYRGYPMVFGITSWRGTRISFTDGMCVGCAVRFRRQWNLPAMPAAAPGLALMRATAAIVLVTGLILPARSLDDVRVPTTRTAPPETVLVPAPADEESMPALAVALAPRRARTTNVSSLRVRSSAVATVSRPPDLSDDVFAADAAPEPVVALDLPTGPPIASDTTIPRVGASTTRRRFPRSSTFASLPHAGLAEQTP